MAEFQMDWERAERTGFPEAVLCDSKSASQIGEIVAEAAQRPLLLTRLSAEKLIALPPAARGQLDYDPISRTAIHGRIDPPSVTGVGIVSAGTSDLPVVSEAARTLRFAGCEASVIADVGVAGLWRLLNRIDEIRAFDVIIAVAGMEGALFSVLAGLVSAPVIAVPASVGYGVGAGGRVALDSALATCAPGVVTVNIDNGFGAACAALRMMRWMQRLPANADASVCRRMAV